MHFQVVFALKDHQHLSIALLTTTTRAMFKVPLEKQNLWSIPLLEVKDKKKILSRDQAKLVFQRVETTQMCSYYKNLTFQLFFGIYRL